MAIAEILLNNGADPNIEDENGNPILALACGIKGIVHSLYTIYVFGLKIPVLLVSSARC